MLRPLAPEVEGAAARGTNGARRDAPGAHGDQGPRAAGPLSGSIPWRARGATCSSAGRTPWACRRGRRSRIAAGAIPWATSLTGCAVVRRRRQGRARPPRHGAVRRDPMEHRAASRETRPASLPGSYVIGPVVAGRRAWPGRAWDCASGRPSELERQAAKARAQALALTHRNARAIGREGRPPRAFARAPGRA